MSNIKEGRFTEAYKTDFINESLNMSVLQHSSLHTNVVLCEAVFQLTKTQGVTMLKMHSKIRCLGVIRFGIKPTGCSIDPINN